MSFSVGRNLGYGPAGLAGGDRVALESRAFLFRILLLFVPVLLALDLVLVPFHAADDENHFALAYTAAHLRIGPVPPPNPSLSSGGYVDAGVPKVIANNFYAVRPRLKGPPGVLSGTAWARRDVFIPLPDTAYFPLVFAPQAVAIRIGEAAGWTVEGTIYAARLANGFSALAIAGLALAFLPEGIAGLFLVILTLPKTLQLISSNSADPLMYGITAALIAFFCRAVTTEARPRAWQYLLAALGVIALGGARPPLTALGLLALYTGIQRRSIWGVGSAVGAMILPLVWWSTVLPALHDTRCPPGEGFVQDFVAFVQHAPNLMMHTFGEHGLYYLLSFIGEIGYGNGFRGRLELLPYAIYPAGMLMLMLGFAGLGADRPRLSLVDRTVPAVVAVGALTGIFLSFAMTCSVGGPTVIGGVQGRYFVVPLLVGAVAVAPFLPKLDRVRQVLRLGLPVFLLTSFATLISVGLEQYWLRQGSV